MKTCINCGEENVDTLDKCWKCGHTLPVEGIKRICVECKETYCGSANRCPYCGGKLELYNVIPNSSKITYKYNSSKSSSNVEIWMFIIAILLPLVGIILGLIQVGKNNNQSGKELIITSLVSNVVAIIIFLLIL